MNSQRLMLSQKPYNWQPQYGNYDAIIRISNDSEEFEQVNELISTSQKYSRKTPTKISRVQNCNFYCQFICRREYLSRLSGAYYSVRRFIQVPQHQLETALTYNLDPRRLGLDQLILTEYLENVFYNYVVLIVHVLSKSQHGSCIPARNTEYYVEYIVNF